MEENGIGKRVFNPISAKCGLLTGHIFHRLVQDGMVEKIWEGTITVLSLDVVRATEKSAALVAFTVVSASVLNAWIRTDFRMLVGQRHLEFLPEDSS